ncbi:ATP-binding cassette domain-containing protein [Pigmentibacter sp. JX0631]|uniref:ABC transporter ATP-binding protein n=1 Tax=Pigmentibacter sp. JX0631 TaxID=2976982 RepID=UPI002468F1AD|nr:ATP-binding cassette domain-containing protein [Pigmentibacter sp. JX0631]WGL60162.1 ATP-binding cassette domain-containing protein [Pigmentibacter sp. JX0631]
MKSIIEINNLIFSYHKNEKILDIPKLEIFEKDRLFLYGPSGCGKTTLLSILTGILSATEGSVKVLNHEFVGLKPSLRDQIRGTEMGYIFQLFNLVPYLNVLENILLPCKLNPSRRKNKTLSEIKEKCFEIAKNLNITQILSKKATDISIGQQQRVAAARALLGDPKIIIADEPTSSLDEGTRELFIQQLFDQCSTQNTSLIFVSHDNNLKKLFNKQINLPELNKVKL